jgi:two-component system, chemotaxis family, CheB/CheR fusion protein
MKSLLHNKVLSANLFPVVGIGASAGGLEAFKRFLKAIPEKSGLAYVLVQHLDPTHKSILPSLLQKVTKIPVREITDDIKVMPDHIYIIPSNKTLVANDGILELSDRPEKVRGIPHLPINLFFTSLAEVHGTHAIGVVLSGNGSDGTLGLKAIKAGGGICFAQDSTSAANDGMPVSAATAGVVDYIMPPEEMAVKLMGLKLSRDNNKPELPGKKDGTYESILSLLLLRKGNDFTHYKDSTIRRRIARRMVLHNETAPNKYLEYLRGDGTEQDALFQDLLIPVTSFFRDPIVFDNLCHSVFPQLLKSKPKDQPLRIWIAGCSTGEEAYSMAMCIKEFFGEMEENVQIFATDISQPAIDKARKGLYTQREVQGINPERLKLFFTKQKDKYLIIKELRDKCVFAVHNFLKDPPFGKLDLVSCRNVLIYMSAYLQKKALTTFHYSLNPNGFLLLGKSESVTNVSNLFTMTSKADKFSQRKPAHSDFQYPFQRPSKPGTNGMIASAIQTVQTDFAIMADAIMMETYTPVGVVVNDALEVVQFRGSTEMYLQIPAGKPSHNLLKMAKNGLAFELRNLLQKAKKGTAKVVKENISLVVAGFPHLVSIEAIPLPGLLEPHYLVVFREAGIAPTRARKPANAKAAALLQKDVNEQYIVQLEKDLAQYREDMRFITAEQEQANEELQSANEELLSGNEELQSLNEELETSKEELQSTNEELTSLNEQFNSARQYSEAIVDTIREPVLVLDKDLRIKTANNAFYNAFFLDKKSTEGILIYELANSQWNIPALRTLLEEIMPQQNSFTGFEVRHNFPERGERVMLLNARELKQGKQEEKLILLAIIDITEQTKHQEAKNALIDIQQKHGIRLEEEVHERTTELLNANKALLQKTEELLKVNVELEAFNYISSHDLQEPLRKIMTYASLLQETETAVLSDKGKEYFTTIQDSAQRMRTLITDLMTYSVTNVNERKFELTDLCKLVEEVKKEIEPLLLEKRGDIEVDGLCEIPANASQMRQVFINLLSNAIKFSKPDVPPHILIKTKKLDWAALNDEVPAVILNGLSQRNSFYRIQVIDNGIGFQPRYQEQIFKIFQRLHSKEQYKGTGIGLAIVKKIADHHNGFVTATSIPGEGATFSIYLPSSLK